MCLWFPRVLAFFICIAVGGEEASAFAHELFLFYRKYLSTILLHAQLEQTPMVQFREVAHLFHGLEFNLFV